MEQCRIKATIEIDGIEIAVNAIRYYSPAEPDVGIFTDEVEWSWKVSDEHEAFADAHADYIASELEAIYQARMEPDDEPPTHYFDGQAEADALTRFERGRGL